MIDCEQGELRGDGKERGEVGWQSEWFRKGGERVESIYHEEGFWMRLS